MSTDLKMYFLVLNSFSVEFKIFMDLAESLCYIIHVANIGV